MAPLHPLSDAAPTTAESGPKLPFAALYAQRYGQSRREQWQRAWDVCIGYWLESASTARSPPTTTAQSSTT